MKNLKSTITLLLVTALIWPTIALAKQMQEAKRAEYLRGDVKEALSLYRSALQEEVSEEAHLGVIRCLRKLGKSEEANAHIARTDYRTWSAKGKALLQAEKRYLSKALKNLAHKYVNKLNRLTPEERKRLKAAIDGKSRKMRLKFRDIRLADVVAMLSKAGDFQYIVSPTVASKKLSLDLKDVSPLEAMHIIASAAGADVANIDDRFTVAPHEELAKMKMSADEKGEEKKGVLLNVRLVEMDGVKEKRTVAAPRVLAINDQQASIKIGGQPNNGSEAMDIEIKAKPVIEADGLIKVTLDCNVVQTKDEHVNQQRKSFTVRLRDGKNFKQRMSKKYAIEVRPMVIENISQAHIEMKAKKQKARRRACLANQKVMTHALHLYLNDNGMKASDVNVTVFKKLVDEGYLTSVPADPGFGKGSQSHYKIKGNRVVCTQHGSLPAGNWMDSLPKTPKPPTPPAVERR